MTKRIIKLTKDQLKEKVKVIVSNILEEGALKPPLIGSDEYNQLMCLNEMAMVNKNEHGNSKNNFDSNIYRVYVIGEGGYKKFPHFHITKPSEGWDIRMNMDGSFNSIKHKGIGNCQNDSDFMDIERIAKHWVRLQNASAPQMTNGEVALLLWNTMN